MFYFYYIGFLKKYYFEILSQAACVLQNQQQDWYMYCKLCKIYTAFLNFKLDSFMPYEGSGFVSGIRKAAFPTFS